MAAQQTLSVEMGETGVSRVDRRTDRGIAGVCQDERAAGGEQTAGLREFGRVVRIDASGRDMCSSPAGLPPELIQNGRDGIVTGGDLPDVGPPLSHGVNEPAQHVS